MVIVALENFLCVVEPIIVWSFFHKHIFNSVSNCHKEEQHRRLCKLKMSIVFVRKLSTILTFRNNKKSNMLCGDHDLAVLIFCVRLKLLRTSDETAVVFSIGTIKPVSFHLLSGHFSNFTLYGTVWQCRRFPDMCVHACVCVWLI